MIFIIIKKQFIKISLLLFYETEKDIKLINNYILICLKNTQMDLVNMLLRKILTTKIILHQQLENTVI